MYKIISIGMMLLILSNQDLHAQSDCNATTIEQKVNNELLTILKSESVNFPWNFSWFKDNELQDATQDATSELEKFFLHPGGSDSSINALVTSGKFPQELFDLFMKQALINDAYSKEKKDISWSQSIFLEVGCALSPKKITQPDKIKACKSSQVASISTGYDTSKLDVFTKATRSDASSVERCDGSSTSFSCNPNSKLKSKKDLVTQHLAKKMNAANQAIDKYESKDAYILRGQVICATAAAVSLAVGLCAWISSKKK